MRLTGIEIANYRAFHGDSFRIELPHGENLLVYGENGAGKSSLFCSIRDFLEAATDGTIRIETNRHRFNNLSPFIRLKLQGEGSPHEWSKDRRGQSSTEWRDIDKGKGCLDYRSLLRVHYLPRGSMEIDLFDLLIESLLAQYKNPASSPSRTFKEEWGTIKYYFQPWRRRPPTLDRLVDAFNAGFASVVADTANHASAVLKRFDAEMEVAFEFRKASYSWGPKCLSSPKVIARPYFRKLEHPDYGRFFNEARLTAMAIAIFFAALKDCPVEGLRLLVLDDILIGLDMVNRLIVLRLMEELFRDWQIVILTYHKAWFEILKERTQSQRWSHPWNSIVLRNRRAGGNQIPIVDFDQSGPLLETAERSLERQDLKGAAVYTRTALEAVLQRVCLKWKLKVRFAKDIRDLHTENLLHPIETELARLRDASLRTEAALLLREVRLARHFVLNAFAHHSPLTEDELSGEVGEAIATVRRFETFMLRLSPAHFTDPSATERASVAELVLLARRLSQEGRKHEALQALVDASEAFIREYLILKQVLVPFRENYQATLLWGCGFPENQIGDAGRAQLRLVKPYLLGHVTTSRFDTGRFDSATRFIMNIAYGALIRVARLRSQQLNEQEAAG